MKKNVLIVAIVILLLIIGGIFISRNKPEDSNSKNITSFKYSFGSFTGGYYDYEINQDGNQYIFVVTGGNGVDLDINETIDQSVLEDIQEIIQKYKVKKWNGFNKSDDDISDGHSFSLLVRYDDYEIKAEGYMKYPRKYMDFQNEIQAYFDSLITSLQD
ncbi:MAG: hypothetical protein K0R34_664 [Herbinix sp.]|nr:hypothetical protein [Herbinix sp.]